MSLKHEFPFFENNPDLVYLDSAATTQKPHSVINAVSDFYQSSNVNVHRGSYTAAKSLTRAYETARAKVASLINAPSSKNIAWTKGTTDSINLVALGWAAHHLNRGDRILLLATEHHANIVPWQQLCLNIGCELDFVELNENQTIDTDTFRSSLNSNHKLVAIQHVSNALGNIHPIDKMCAVAKANGSVVLVDGAQAIAHQPVDVQQLDCDFYVFSAHKVYGPTGIGVLYAADSVKDTMRPVQFGGEMIVNVSRQSSQFQHFPSLLETGTPNIASVIGFAAAIEFVLSDAYKQAHLKLPALYKTLIDQLSAVEGVRLLGDQHQNVGIASFVIEGESVADVGMLLDQQNIAVRCGHHCTMPLMESLGVDGTIRVSLSVYNDEEDIARFVSALKFVIEMLDID